MWCLSIKLNKIVHAKIKGAALMYSVFVMVVVGIVCSSMITLSYYKRKETEGIIIKSMLLRNAESGLNLMMATDGLGENNLQTTISLFGNETDTVILSKKYWGLYQLITARATWHHEYVERRALAGDIFPDTNQTALVLADHDKSLYVCGNTLIKGDCYLPRNGVERGYIEGKNFVGSQLIQGKINKSETTLPDPEAWMLDLSIKSIKNAHAKGDSILLFQLGVFTDTLINSFEKKTLVLYSPNPLVIKAFIKGNILIISDSQIEISKESIVEDALVVAPYIHIEDRFQGSLQLFASDSILTGNEVQLNYPSSLGIINNEIRKVAPFIRFGEKNNINGIIFNWSKNTEKQYLPRVHIGSEAEITGTIYCNGYVEMRGKLKGNLYASALFLRTPSSVYENYFLDVTIDAQALPKKFAGLNLAKNKVKGIAKWL